MLCALDRAAHGGGETGRLPKSDVRTALRAYFRVGQPGGKTEARFDAMMQALDAVSGGGESDGGGRGKEGKEKEGKEKDVVLHATLFAEDREFNQGEFAETVRDQALSERLEFFAELEAALVEQAGGATSHVTRAHVAAALGLVDPTLTAAQAWDRANAAFEPGVAASGVEIVMRSLKAGGGRRLRLSSAVGVSGSILGGGGGGGGGGMGGSVFGGGGGGSKGGLALKAAARAALAGGNASSSSSPGPMRLSKAALAALETARQAWMAPPASKAAAAAAAVAAPPPGAAAPPPLPPLPNP